ncbi:MAG: hypothetical protein ACOY3Z_02240 [Thermodesulfobacteriota bacterium]
MVEQPGFGRNEAKESGEEPVADFRRAVCSFIARQQSHGQAMQSGNLREIFSWRREREQAFRVLVQRFERLALSADFPATELQGLLGCLQEILDGERELANRVVALQDDIKSQLFSMRRGKGALQGYSVNRGQMARPRYLSNRT